MTCRIFCASLLLLFSTSALADLSSTRWTGFEDTRSDLKTVLAKANASLGTDLQETDLKLAEEQDLGVWKFQMWTQDLQGLKVDGASLRIWKNLDGEQLVQAEANFLNASLPATRNLMRLSQVRRHTPSSAAEIVTLARSVKLQKYQNSKTEDVWHPSYGPVRRITIFAKFYKWEILQSLTNGQVISKVRKDYPQADLDRRADEFEMPALVYKTPEEASEDRRGFSGALRQNVTLKYLKRQAPLPTQNIFSEFTGQVFADSKQDEVKGQTEEGRAEGFWSMAYLKGKLADLIRQVSPVENSISEGRSYLIGRFVSVQIHPDARAQFQPSFPEAFGASASYIWKELGPLPSGQNDWGFGIVPTHLGLAAHDFWDFYNRPAPWRLQHDTTALMNEGFDEVQAYWSVNQWFETLHNLGFNDPEISTRPITAILFDPDIESRDNAFYTSDTINFSTYSQDSANYARDTGTIWHELGHGLEDRILKEARYDGGLSEGMADLAADLILNDVTNGQDYPGKTERRIVNSLHFNMTNEEHDNGEAYGGTLHALSEQILKAEGMPGFRKFADLILDSMRLSRNNPDLNLQEWFRRVLFADQWGKPGIRKPGEFASRIQAVLQERNFSFDPADSAQLPIEIVGVDTLTGSSPGSRYNPIRVDLQTGESKQFQLKIKAVDGAKTRFQFPVKVSVSYRGGPLQGSAKFQDEDQVHEWTLHHANEEITVPVTVLADCDQINRNDQRCSDFAYIRVFNANSKDPIGKKRFYVNVNAITL